MGRRRSGALCGHHPHLTTARPHSGDFPHATSTFSSRHRAFFRYNLADNRLSEPGSTPDLGSADSNTRGQNYTGSITTTVRPTLLHEFRFNLLYGAIHLSPYLPGTDFNKDAGIKGMENLRRSFDTGSFR